MEQLNLSNISLPSSPSIRDIDNIVRDLEGEPLVQLHIGQPGLRMPATSRVSILENLQRLEQYTPMGGSADLRRAISSFFGQMTGIYLEPSYITATSGGMNAGFTIIGLASMMKGDGEREKSAVLISPYFPSTLRQICWHGLQPVTVPFNRGQIACCLETCLQAYDVKIIVYSSPNNPSGLVMDKSELKQIGELANNYGAIVASDDAYLGLDYSSNGLYPHVLSSARLSASLGSGSKIFSLAGLRAGYIGMTPTLYEQPLEGDFSTIRTHNAKVRTFGEAASQYVLDNITSDNSVAEVAYPAALEDLTAFQTLKAAYSDAYRYAKETFKNAGFSIADYGRGEPNATLYFLVSHPEFGSGVELMKDLLRCRIVVAPAENMGAPSNTVRISVAKLVEEKYRNLLNDGLELFNQLVS